MSTDQDARAGWSSDRGELAPPLESEAPETTIAPPSVIRPAVDPKDQAVEWMRWMGFTDAERARVGVSLFLFDRQADPRPSGVQSVELVPQTHVSHTGEASAQLALDGRRAPEAGPLAYPTLVADERAVRVIRGERQGHLTNRELLQWVRQSWVPLYRIRTDFTSKSGLRSELRFASRYQLFDSISGQPIRFNAPKIREALKVAGAAVVPTSSRVPAADVIDQTVAIWNDYCGHTDKTAIKRYAAVLEARGVPAAAAHTIDLEVDSRILLPVFVGLLTHSTGHRLVVLDGVDGRHQAGLSSAMTLNLRSVHDELERNRLVKLTSA
jgi:hypothetical protein